MREGRRRIVKENSKEYYDQNREHIKAKARKVIEANRLD